MLFQSRWSFGRPFARHVRLAIRTVSTERGGRNLTERYRRLETTRSELSQGSTNVELLTNGPVHSTIPNTIVGFVIPQEPRAPADDECCMSGCAVCVYDLYEEELSTYKDSVTKLRTALSARHIPENEWPPHIRTSNMIHTTPTAIDKSKGAVLGAFEEMERVLREKREKRAAVETEKRARGDVLAGDGERVRLDLRGVYEGIRWVIFPNR